MTAAADSPAEWTVASSRLDFEGGLVSIRTDLLVDGDTTFARDVVEHPGAVAIVAVDADDRVLVIEQYRHPARARLVEIPAGLLDVSGEEPLAAAQRELREEGRLEADTWTPLFVLRPSPGISTEQVHLFLAEDVREVGLPPGFTAVHEESTMTRRWIPLAELVDSVVAGSVSNALTIAGSLAVWHLRHRKA